MKKFSKIWWVLEVISLIITIINPYIGLFGAFTIVEAIVLGALSINIRVIRKSKNELANLISPITKVLGIALPIFFLIGTSVVDFMCCAIGSVQKRIALPFNLFSNNMSICNVLLLVTIILNIVKAICFMGKVKED